MRFTFGGFHIVCGSLHHPHREQALLMDLAKLIHEKVRLGIMSLLASSVERWAFQDLKSELKMSDRNLITHLWTLEKAEFVTSEKVEGVGCA